MNNGPPNGLPPFLQPGVTGMNIDRSSRVPQIVSGVVIPFALATIFVAGRLWGRVVIVRSWGWDDTFLAISWTIGLGFILVACISTNYGSGHHLGAIPFQDAIPALKLQYANLLLYQAALASTKFSICLFYLRLFSDKRSKYMIFSIMAYVIGYFLPCEMIDMFQCVPLAAIWNRQVDGQCINNGPCFYTSAVCNIVGDTLLISLVAPKLWPLKMPRRQKIALMSVITSGWLVIVAAIVRVIRVSRSQGSFDKSWTYYDVAIWSSVEISVGLFCVSAPAIKPLIQRYFPHIIFSTYNLNDTPHYTQNRYINSTKKGRGSMAQNGTITFINSGVSKDLEEGFQLQNLKGVDGKTTDSGGSRSHSKNGNRTFWWDKRDGGASDSDSESLDQITANSALPAGVEGEVPSTGILKSTSVTVSIQQMQASVEAQRAEIGRGDSLVTRGKQLGTITEGDI